LQGNRLSQRSLRHLSDFIGNIDSLQKSAFYDIFARENPKETRPGLT